MQRRDLDEANSCFDVHQGSNVKQLVKHVCVTAAAAVLLTVLPASTAYAQETPVGDVSFGYQWQRASATDCEGDDCSETLPAGWYVDISGGSHMFRLVGQFDGSSKSDAFDETGLQFGLLTYGAGVRTNATDGSVRPFAQFLVGGMRTKFTEPGFDEPAENAFMIDLGGGVNIPAGGRWGARVGFDYRRGFFKEEEGGAVNTFRFNIGVLFNLVG